MKEYIKNFAIGLLKIVGFIGSITLLALTILSPFTQNPWLIFGSLGSTIIMLAAGYAYTETNK